MTYIDTRIWVDVSPSEFDDRDDYNAASMLEILDGAHSVAQARNTDVVQVEVVYRLENGEHAVDDVDTVRVDFRHNPPQVEMIGEDE